MDIEKSKKEEALLLRAGGAPIEEIIHKTGLNPLELVDYFAEVDNTITTLRGIRQEAAFKAYGVRRKDRLKRMVALRNKVEEEIDKRDFSDIPTEKLPSILLKINEAIRAEVTTPQIISNPIERQALNVGRECLNIANE